MIVAVDRLTDFYKLPKISVSVERCLPNHAGFGSKTTLLLTLGFAYCKLFDLDFNLKNIFKILKRNSKSGVGSFAALYGGFIWENGFKSNIVTKDGGILPELQEHFYPNSDFKIVHFRFDNGEIFGEKEEKLIMDSKDASNEEIKKVKDSIKDLIIPSLKNGNEEELQKGIKIIEENGLKVYEWSQQSKKTLDFVEYYKKSKFPLSLGLSSWGPTMYFVTKHPKTAIDFINRYNINKPLHLQVSSIATEGFKFKEQYI